MRYLIILSLLLSMPLLANDTTTKKGYVELKPYSSKSKSTTSRTTGYIDHKQVRVKTRTKANGSTVTTGYIGGKRVHVKTKKD